MKKILLIALAFALFVPNYIISKYGNGHECRYNSSCKSGYCDDGLCQPNSLEAWSWLK